MDDNQDVITNFDEYYTVPNPFFIHNCVPKPKVWFVDEKHF